MSRKLFLMLGLIVFSTFGCGLQAVKNDLPEQVKPPEITQPEIVTVSPPPVETSVNSTEKNLLSLANGAVLLKHPAPNSWQFSPIRIIDGTESFWISNKLENKAQVFVIGLPSETILKKFSFVGGNDYYGAGSSAKDISIEVSATNINESYQTVLETSLPENVSENQMFPVSVEIPARFVRLTIKNSHQNPDYISLDDFRGYGSQKAEPSLTGLTGTYFPISRDEETSEYKALNAKEAKNAYVHFNNINLKQEGTVVYGCREQGDNDRFEGGIEGNIAQTVWSYGAGEEKEKSIMSFSPDGKLMFHTVFTAEGGLADYIAFQRVSETPGECANVTNFNKNGGSRTQIEETLEKEGRAVIYGINFDFNSDKLRDESKVILDGIVNILKEKTDWKMTIEGHTDNIGGEDFNRKLSEKRARAVVVYLSNAGIDASRLAASGKGLENPVASNETDFGRAQNRRVELIKQ